MEQIKLIQAKADAAHVTAEAGNASRELTEALAEYGRLDAELKKARAKADELVAAARQVLLDAGKEDEEAQELIQVTIFSRRYF